MANLLTRISNFLTGKKADKQLSGSQIPLSVGSSRVRSTSFDLPFYPVRPINGNLADAYDLVEIANWSYEARHAVSILARDCFQSIDGEVDAWFIKPQKGTDGEEIPLNPEFELIANGLKNRTYGKVPVIGGNLLEKAVRDMLFYGDCFLELGLDKDQNGNYYINRSLYLPSLQIFAQESDQGDVEMYFQRKQTKPSKDDLEIHPLKMLHFSYEKDFIYGSPITQQSLEIWRKIKETSPDIEDAARAVGVSPWLHIMPEDADESYKQGYRQEYESMLATGIVTNLYLRHGSDLKKASTGDTSLDSMLSYFLSLRKQMIPPGMPLWLFPGLMENDKGSNDLQGQPALNYARKIAYIRSIVGEQIKWAIALEVVLQKGYEWYLKNGAFDIGWGKWQTSTLEVALEYADTDEK